MNTRTFVLILFLLVAGLIALPGCGLQRQVDALKDKTSAQDKRISDLNKQIKALSSSINSTITQMDGISDNLSAQQEMYTQLNAAYQAGDASLQANLDELVGSMELLSLQQGALQLAINTQQAALVQLQLNETIAAFVDPCGPSGGFDEVVMRTSTGKMVAYFESGGNRYLSILKPGAYQTTDSQHCYFTVNNAGQICEGGNAASCH